MIDPFFGSAAGAAANLIGGIFSSNAAAKAAKAQLQAVRETNQANAQLAQKQNDWNLAQWNRQNSYNTPAAQRARYEEAGINPYFALGNIQSGMADSLSSADLANQQPVTSELQGQSSAILANSLSRAGSDFFNMSLQGEQAKKLQIENTFEASKLKEQVDSLKYDNVAKKMANDVYNSSLESLKNIAKNQERLSYIHVATQSLQQVGTAYDVAMKKFQQKYLQPQQYNLFEMNLNQMVADIARTKAEERWTNKQTKLAATYAAAAMLSSQASWLQGLAAQKNAATAAYSAGNEAWNRNQSTYRSNYIFNKAKDFMVDEIVLGVNQLSNQKRLSDYQLHDMDYGLNPARRWFGVGSWTPNVLLSPSDIKSARPKRVKGFRK